MASDRRRVLLVEDHQVVAEGIKLLLEPHFEILGPVNDGSKVLDVVGALHPEAVILDISLPGRNGFDLLPDLHQRYPRLPIVMLTGSADFLVGRTAMALGALGFLAKDCGAEELELALRTVLGGKKYLSPRVPPPPAGVMLGDLPPTINELTPRQLELLRLIGAGVPSDQIAGRLNVTLHTVHFHRRNLRRVLGVESEAGLARIATVFQVREEAR